MYKVVLVEDEELIARSIKLNLEKSGYEVMLYETAEEFLSGIMNRTFDIILLDIMLPGMDGEAALQKIREREVSTPVLMLTAIREVITKVKSLDLGADDYLTKPFTMPELEARIRALIRRSRSNRALPSDKIIKIGKNKLNLDSRIAKTNIGEIILSEREADLIAYFYKNAGETLSRTDILEEVWGMDVYPTPRTVDNFVAKFRKLFEDNPTDPKHFISVRSVGYRFEL